MGHRKKPKRIVDIDSFVADATELHRTIIKYSHSLRPGCAHARALGELHDVLLKTIRDITGDEVPWAKTPPAHMTVARGPQSSENMPGDGVIRSGDEDGRDWRSD